MHRAVWLLALATGCNAVFQLDTTEPADPNNPFDPRDYDLDGVSNFIDNCPSLANAGQEDRDGDQVGDVCDPHPDTPGDQIVERTFFADPRTERDRWNVDAFVFEAGGVVAQDPTGFATLRSKRTYEQPFTVVELGFEATAWNLDPYLGGLSITLDDFGGPSVLFRKTVSYTLMAANGPGYVSADIDRAYLSPELGVNVPFRVTLTFDRRTLLAIARLGAETSQAQTTSLLPSGPVMVTLEEMAARLRFVMIYVAD